MTSTTFPDSVNLTVRHTAPAGLIAGLFGCVLGLIGVFAFAVFFAPVAMLCGLVGLVVAIFGRSPAGVGASLLAMALAAFAAIKSPALWLLLGIGLFAASAGSTNNAQAPKAPTPAIAREAMPAATQAAAQPAADIESAADWLESFNSRSQTVITRLPMAERRYQAITAQMADRTRQLSELRDPVERSQAGVAISQGAVATDQVRVDVEALRNEIRVALDGQRDAVQRAIDQCRGVAIADTRQGTCRRLVAANSQLAATVETLSAGFAGLEATYQAERAKQQVILRRVDELTGG